MKCEQAQRWILLSGSGELDGRDARKLEQHLAECAGCRAYHADLTHCLAAAARLAPDPAVSPATLEAIRGAARVPAPRRLIWFPSPTVQALAYAALLTLVASGWTLWVRARAAADRAGELPGIIAVLSSSGSGPAAAQGQLYAEEDSRLQALGRQILEMESQWIEDAPSGAAAELVTPPSEPEPTALRWRSTVGSPTRRCV